MQFLNAFRPWIPVFVAAVPVYSCLADEEANLLPDAERATFIKNANQIYTIVGRLFVTSACLITLNSRPEYLLAIFVGWLLPEPIQKIVNRIAVFMTNWTLASLAVFALGKVWMKVYAIVPLAGAISCAYLGSCMMGSSINREKKWKTKESPTSS